MTPQDNVDAVLTKLGGGILATEKRISHIAVAIDISHQTISRILARTDRPNKGGCSLVNAATIANFLGYKLDLIPLNGGNTDGIATANVGARDSSGSTEDSGAA